MTIPWITLARTHINYTGIQRINRQRTDALHIHFIENGRPTNATVYTLPHTTAGSSGVNHIAIHRSQCTLSRHGQSSNPTTHGTRTDVPLRNMSHHRLKLVGFVGGRYSGLSVCIAQKNRTQNHCKTQGFTIYATDECRHSRIYCIVHFSNLRNTNAVGNSLNHILPHSLGVLSNKSGVALFNILSLQPI